MVQKLFNGSRLEDQINNGSLNLVEMVCTSLDLATNHLYSWPLKNKMLMMEDNLKSPLMKTEPCIGEWKEPNHDLLFEKIKFL